MAFRFQLHVHIAFALSMIVSSVAADESLETRLREMAPVTIAAQAKQRGNPKAGALVFYKSAAACVKCHSSGKTATPLGPDLATLGQETTDLHIIESILHPSHKIRKGFETISVVTIDGKVVTGLVAADEDERLVLRDATNLEQEITIKKSDIEEMIISEKSMMPDGLVSSLRDERQFYDLVRYVMEVARGGSQRADQLKPKPQDLIVIDDTKDLNHTGILRSLGSKDFAAGKVIYLGHCKNCHGLDGNTPKLPTARAFGRQKLKFGADPYQMLLTLSRGNGMMAPMSHLSPKERYQVVHYIREAFMKPSNPEYTKLDDDYFASLPKGTGNGEFLVTLDRDFGSVLGSQLGAEVNNALTFRLSDDITACYDLHRMRLNEVWQGGFLDLSQTQHYRQRGERMPQIDGQVIPGLGDWQWAFDDSFEISSEAKPPRGPVRSDWLQYNGHYLFADQAVLSYGIHGRKVLETIQAEKLDELVILSHTLRVEPSQQELKLCVGKLHSRIDPSGLISNGETSVMELTGNAKDHIAVVTGSPNARGNQSKRRAKSNFSNLPWHVIASEEARKLDLGTPDRTILVRFRTKGSGTLIASTPAKGQWAPNGKTLFVRGQRLVYDIGWVGAMTSKTNVADGEWHTAVLIVSNEKTRLFVDGKLESEKKAFRRDPVTDHVLKIGATATNFGGDFDGDIESVHIFDAKWSNKEVQAATGLVQKNDLNSLLSWKPGRSDIDSNPKIVSEDKPAPLAPFVAAAVDGETDGLTWEIDEAGRIILTIPAARKSRVFRVLRGGANGGESLKLFVKHSQSISTNQKLIDPKSMTHGGPERWSQELTVHGELGESINGYALDTIPVPFENPWNAWMRTSALDFFDDGRAVVTTQGGDVYIVSGIDSQLQNVTWKRFVAGLFEPFGVRVVDDMIYVTCRDGIKRLHDYDNNGEADFIEAFWIDDDVSSMFHAYNFDLQTDSQGNFYFAKAGQYTQHHRPGTIMRVPPEGGRADVVAWGIRTPNGMGKLDDDRFTVSDNQGPWIPAGKISLIKPGSFLGNMPINKEQDAWLKTKHGGILPTTFDEPIIWTPQELDNSCGGQVWVADERFGPLSGRLIHSSYGKGWLYYMSLQEIKGQTQASIVTLPHQWDAGVMRLRVSPNDGQLYGTGLSGWQGPPGGKDGCLQRLRYTGDPVRMIENVAVTSTGLELTFNFALDPQSVTEPMAWQAEMWNYLWSRKYGSDQFSVLTPGEKGHDKLSIRKVTLTGDRKLNLTIPNLQACDQFSLQMDFKDHSGESFIEHVYLTIHAQP